MELKYKQEHGAFVTSIILLLLLFWKDKGCDMLLLPASYLWGPHHITQGVPDYLSQRSNSRTSPWSNSMHCAAKMHDMGVGLGLYPRFPLRHGPY
jgi:hypothetical protein